MENSARQEDVPIDICQEQHPGESCICSDCEEGCDGEPYPCTSKSCGGPNHLCLCGYDGHCLQHAPVWLALPRLHLDLLKRGSEL